MILFSCAATIIVNLTNIWMPIDNWSKNRARVYCESDKKVPCLKKFIKKEHLTYNAICGVEEKKNS